MNSKRYRRILFFKTIFVTKMFQLYYKFEKSWANHQKLPKAPGVDITQSRTFEWGGR